MLPKAGEFPRKKGVATQKWLWQIEINLVRESNVYKTQNLLTWGGICLQEIDFKPKKSAYKIL